jgi:hypothetical protein
MDPFTIASLASMGIGTLGSILGGSNDADQYIQKALEQYEGIIPPDLAEAIVYTQFQQGGQLTPEQLSALPIEAQKAVQIVESPEMRQKQEVQRQALEQLSRTGMGPQEMLALEKVRRTTASDAQARLQSLMGKYQQMGQAGGGASLAAALQSNQAADDQASMQAMQAASMAAENRRSAIKQAYDAASGMRATDLDVTKTNAENERQKQMFDIQNAINRQKINAENRAAAQRFNVERQQSVQDKNIAQQNEEALRRNYTAKQQMYQNQLGLARAKADAYSGRAGIEQQRGEARARNWMNLGTGGAEIFGNLAQSGNDEDEDKTKKKTTSSTSGPPNIIK